MTGYRPDQDAFGRVLLERLDGNDRARIVIERDDGFVDAEDAAAYFDVFRKWFPVERQALRYVRGRVLDVGAGVVEVDVREQQVPDVLEGQPALGEAGLQRADRRRRPAVEQREAVVGLDDVDADDAVEAEVHEVDRLEAHASSFSRTAA